MADKEAREKMAFEFYNARALAGDMPWSQATAVGGVMVDLAYAKATQVLRDLEKLGYRKLPKDRTELRKKIIELIDDNALFTEGEYSPLAGPITSDATELLISSKELADQILALIPKLPKDKPPLLSDEEIHKAHFSNRGKYDRDARRAIAQAQREADIKWYTGKAETES